MSASLSCVTLDAMRIRFRDAINNLPVVDDEACAPEMIRSVIWLLNVDFERSPHLVGCGRVQHNELNLPR